MISSTLSQPPLSMDAYTLDFVFTNSWTISSTLVSRIFLLDHHLSSHPFVCSGTPALADCWFHHMSPWAPVLLPCLLSPVAQNVSFLRPWLAMFLDLAMHGNGLRTYEPAPLTQTLWGGGAHILWITWSVYCIVSSASGPRSRLGNMSCSISSAYLLQSHASYYFPCPTAITQVDAPPSQRVCELSERRQKNKLILVELTGLSMMLYS